MLKKLYQAYVLKLASFEKRVQYYTAAGMKIGINVQIFGDVSFGSEPFLISLGDDVKITSGCQFITHDGGVHVLRNKYPECVEMDVFGKISVGNNVFFGNRCIVLPNVAIGDNVVIGAGSIVTKDIPSNTVSCGVPCKQIRNIEEYKASQCLKSLNTKKMNKTDKKDFLINKYCKN